MQDRRRCAGSHSTSRNVTGPLPIVPTWSPNRVIADDPKALSELHDQRGLTLALALPSYAWEFRGMIAEVGR